MENFLCEQYHIVAADTRSMEHLVSRFEGNDVIREYFRNFYEGEKLAHGKLLAMAKTMGLSDRFLRTTSLKPVPRGILPIFVA